MSQQKPMLAARKARFQLALLQCGQFVLVKPAWPRFAWIMAPRRQQEVPSDTKSSSIVPIAQSLLESFFVFE